MSGLEAHLRVRRDDGFVLDMSLSLDHGETVALLGPNGAGKSTAVSALAGLVPLDEGEIVLGGRTLDSQDVFVRPDLRRIGVVFQDYLLFPHLTAAENVAFGVRDRKRRREAAITWLARVGLADFADHMPGSLSGGQAQRVALARALASAPELLLLDEPLAALDVRTRLAMRRVLSEHLRAFPGPRLLITHDPTEAFTLADRILVLEAGSLTQVGTADDIRLRPRTRYVAELAGSNLFVGVADEGSVDVGGHVLQIADRFIAGPVTVTVRPSAVTVHLVRPAGSPRNVWETVVDLLEPIGDRVRLLTGAPLPLTVEITAESAVALGLGPGVPVWVAVKATEVEVEEG
jgi:molybdate transport system ATP-binding protein